MQMLWPREIEGPSWPNIESDHSNYMSLCIMCVGIYWLTCRLTSKFKLNKKTPTSLLHSPNSPHPQLDISLSLILHISSLIVTNFDLHLFFSLHYLLLMMMMMMREVFFTFFLFCFDGICFRFIIISFKSLDKRLPYTHTHTHWSFFFNKIIYSSLHRIFFVIVFLLLFFVLLVVVVVVVETFLLW